MKAVQLIKPGAPLQLREVATPQPGRGEVLIQVRSAGICHSDVHYRAGVSRVEPLPLTLGHEVAGVVAAVGFGVKSFQAGDRVCLHYLATCGECFWCRGGNEQFCRAAEMIGKQRDGGYAEYILMPERSVFQLPDEIPFSHGAVMMCSSATSLHALRKARLQTGESVAVFGIGGLGISAVQLAFALGAREVFAIDLNPKKLHLAASLGARPINASVTDPVSAIWDLTAGQGADVALELIGLPQTMQQAVNSLGNKGRAAIAGITEKTFPVAPYRELIGKEAEIIGVSDHLASELPELLAFARGKQLVFDAVVSRSVKLDAGEINAALDQLQQFGDEVRTVVEI